ncbi:MAG: LysM peptidoglycan-binding domain-containing protein [Clostridiales bacterium]|nr:LysM peptidoglycan-binding domain-containing protein [Clostridiales bacterium]
MYAYLKKNERKVRIRRNLIIVLLGAIAAITLFLAGGACLNARQAQASDAQTEAVCYKSVYVHAGDTLWDIADEYMDDAYDTYNDKNDYIDEIKQINHITEADLQAGSYIIVPYIVME